MAASVAELVRSSLCHFGHSVSVIAIFRQLPLPVRALRSRIEFWNYDAPLRSIGRLTLTMLPSAGQEGKSEMRIQIKKMGIPRYLPLARQAGISGDVTLHLTVNKSGEVTAVDVVSAHPKEWGKGFASMAIEAARLSQFSCASCENDTFEHTVTYQFDFPPIPNNACTLQPPPPIPPSKVDSVSHVTVRPKAWPCVEP